jgi:hypothetical protein
MEKCETYPQLKLISQKVKKIRTLVASIIAVSVVGVLLSWALSNSCGIEHVSILSEIQTYEKTLDPEFCDRLVNRILEFNDSCEPYIEIFDCG